MFRNTLKIELSNPSPMLISSPKQLAPFYAGQPIVMFDTLRKNIITCSCSFVSFPRIATRYALLMEPSITIPDVTSGNAVSNAMMLCLKPPHPHSGQAHTLFPKPVPQSATTTQQTQQSIVPVTPEPGPDVPVSTPTATPKPHPSYPIHCYPKCSTCATMEVGQCKHSTKMPDYRDVTEEVTAPALQMMYLTQNAHGPYYLSVHLGAGH